MFSLNRVHIIGYQTQPVELRQTPSGTSVTDLNLVTPYTFESSAGSQTGKNFHTVTVWSSMAEVASQFIKPGAQVFISGRLQTDSWEDQNSGEKRNKTKIVALDLILLDPKDGQIELPEGSPQKISSINEACIIGHATRDPEMRTTPSGQNVLTLGVATNEKWRDRTTDETKERTEFHNIVVWRELAQQVQKTIKKGNRVYASGRVQTRSFETKDGQKRYTTEIVADEVMLLGVKSAIAAESVRTDSVPAKTSEPQQKEPTSAEVSGGKPVAVGNIPEVNYESDVKAEDLPF